MKKPNIIGGIDTLGREGSGIAGREGTGIAGREGTGIYISREGAGYAGDIRPGTGDGIGGAISQEGIGVA